MANLKTITICGVMDTVNKCVGNDVSLHDLVKCVKTDIDSECIHNLYGLTINKSYKILEKRWMAPYFEFLIRNDYGHKKYVWADLFRKINPKELIK